MKGSVYVCMFVCVLEIAILSAASSCREAKLLQVGDAVEVNESPGDHQDVEQLMGVKLRREQQDIRITVKSF